MNYQSECCAADTITELHYHSDLDITTVSVQVVKSIVIFTNKEMTMNQALYNRFEYGKIAEDAFKKFCE